MTDSNTTLPQMIMTMYNMLKTRKNVLWLLAFLLMAVSCETSELDNGNFLGNSEEVDLTSNPRITIPASAETVTVSFKTDKPWTASLVNERPQQWCSISPESGEAGTSYITVTTTENLDSEDRSALIVLKTGGEKYQSVMVTQKQRDALTVTESVFELSEESSEFTVEVKANVNYSFSISQNAQDWLHIVETKALQTSHLVFQADQNDDLDPREGEIVITDGNLTETIRVYQQGSDPRIILGTDDYIIGSDGDEFIVQVSSNVDVTMSIEQGTGASWLRETATKAMSSHTYYFTVDANSTYDNRSAQIVFKNNANHLEQRVNVTQLQKNAIVLAHKEYEFGMDGGTLDLTVQTNVDFDVTISANWITQASTKGLESRQLFFNIASYSQQEDRQATIKLSGGGIEQVITVKQGGYGDIVAKQRAALIELYNATGGDNWTYNTNWCSSKPLSQWYGLYTNSWGIVYRIELIDNNLNGAIPESIGTMVDLSGIWLHSNNLYGSIPSSFGNLTNLSQLSLYNNALTGSIPESLGNIKSLGLIDLGSNKLSGSIPSSLFTIDDLYNLNLSNNKLSGEIPANIGSAKSLMHLQLSDNELTGNIPDMSGLEKLVNLYIAGNQLTGSIPMSICNLKKLETLSLAYNNLSGEIPSEIGNLVELQYFYLNNNHLAGGLPESMGNLTKLKQLFIQDNQLTGIIPESVLILPELESFVYDQDKLQVMNDVVEQQRAALVALYNATDGDNWTNNMNWCSSEPLSTWYGISVNSQGQVIAIELSNNNLNGTIPQSIGVFKELLTLDMNLNNLSGTIPSSIGNLTNLRQLRIYNNSLSGSLPVELENLQNLTIIELDGNNLSGEIPYGIFNNTNLQTIYLSSNELTGGIPSNIANATSLYYLYLGYNKLSGEIPVSFGNATQLRNVDLSNNELTGSIPASLGNLTNLEGLYLGNNNLYGEIPVSLCNLSNLRSMYLHHNGLTGSIPDSLANFTNLKYMDLSYTGLTGSIPASLGDLTNLEMLNLSNNGLTGSIPTSLGNLANIKTIYLQNNSLSGSIPSSLGNLANLEVLYLNNNALTGSIPTSFGNLTNLRYLRLENNQLSGTIPQSIFSLPYLSDFVYYGNNFSN